MYGRRWRLTDARSHADNLRTFDVDSGRFRRSAACEPLPPKSGVAGSSPAGAHNRWEQGDESLGASSFLFASVLAPGFLPVGFDKIIGACESCDDGEVVLGGKVAQLDDAS
jgi:hypothetical protein